MARKSKLISKEPKAEKKGKPAEDDDEEGDIFSQTFRDRLNNFSSLSKEVLTIKAEIEGNNPNQEISERRQRVSGRVEEASAAILKGQLQSLEQWILDQQKILADQVQRIRSAQGRNRRSLEETGAFSAAEIEKQVQVLGERAEERQSIHDEYGQLLIRSKSIYNS